MSIEKILVLDTKTYNYVDKVIENRKDYKNMFVEQLNNMSLLKDIKLTKKYDLLVISISEYKNKRFFRNDQQYITPYISHY